jgi:hypothetical protein
MDRNFHILEALVDQMPNTILRQIEGMIPQRNSPELKAIEVPSGPPTVYEPDDETEHAPIPTAPPPPARPQVKVEQIVEHFIPRDIIVDAFQLSKARIMVAGDLEDLKIRVVDLYEFSKRSRFEMRAIATEIGLMTNCYQHLIMDGYTIPTFVIPTPAYDAEFCEYFANLHTTDTADWLVCARILHECVVERNDPQLQERGAHWILARGRAVLDGMIKLMREVLTQYEDRVDVDEAVDKYIKGHPGADITDIWNRTGWRYALRTEYFVDGVERWQPCMLADLFIDC